MFIELLIFSYETNTDIYIDIDENFIEVFEFSPDFIRLAYKFISISPNIDYRLFGEHELTTKPRTSDETQIVYQAVEIPTAIEFYYPSPDHYNIQIRQYLHKNEVVIEQIHEFDNDLANFLSNFNPNDPNEPSKSSDLNQFLA